MVVMITCAPNNIGPNTQPKTQALNLTAGPYAETYNNDKARFRSQQTIRGCCHAKTYILTQKAIVSLEES